MRMTVLSLVLACAAGEASAQQRDPIFISGRHLAEELCSQCHAISKDAAQDGRRAPAFPAVARMPSTTAISLEAFLLTPHAEMTNYQLTNQQITDLVNYILSLRSD